MSAAFRPQTNWLSGCVMLSSRIPALKSIHPRLAKFPRCSHASSFQLVGGVGDSSLRSSRPKRGSPGRSWITKYQPGLAAAGGQIEAEEADVRLDLRLEDGSLDEQVRIAVVELPDEAVLCFLSPPGLLRVDDGGRIFLEQISAHDEHQPRVARLGSGRQGPAGVCAERALAVPRVQLLDVEQLLFHLRR